MTNRYLQKVTQHHYWAWEWKSKPRWDITSHMYGWLLWKKNNNGNKCWQGYEEIGTPVHRWWELEWCKRYGKQHRIYPPALKKEHRTPVRWNPDFGGLPALPFSCSAIPSSRDTETAERSVGGRWARKRCCGRAARRSRCPCRRPRVFLTLTGSFGSARWGLPSVRDDFLLLNRFTAFLSICVVRFAGTLWECHSSDFIISPLIILYFCLLFLFQTWPPPRAQLSVSSVVTRTTFIGVLNDGGNTYSLFSSLLFFFSISSLFT